MCTSQQNVLASLQRWQVASPGSKAGSQASGPLLGPMPLTRIEERAFFEGGLRSCMNVTVLQAPYSNAQINELGIPDSIVNGSNYGAGPFATGVTAFQPFRAVTSPDNCIRTLFDPQVAMPASSAADGCSAMAHVTLWPVTGIQTTKNEFCSSPSHSSLFDACSKACIC